MSFDTLFSPINIRGLCLPNRVVMSAMGTHMPAASADGRSVTDQMIAYHVARVKGGCGLMKCSPKVGQKLCGKAILNSVLDRT